MATDNKAPDEPKLPSPENKSELSDEQLNAVTGGAGSQPFLRFKFGTVFTTKIDASSHGDDEPKED